MAGAVVSAALCPRIMLYRNWLNLNLHLLWCHNRFVAEGAGMSGGQPLRFTEFTNSAAWLVREGMATVEHDGQSFTARPGQWLIVKPGPRVQTFAADTRMLSIAFEARWPDGSHLFGEGLSLVIESAEAPELERKVRPILDTVIKIAPGTWDLRGHAADLRCFLRLEMLLCEWLSELSEVVERYGVQHTGHFGIDERIRVALDLLQAQDLALPIDLEALAAAVHVSPNHLIRLFRKDLRSTPNQYWDRLRIEQATNRLRQPGSRIKEVAIDLGFRHLSHFSKWFKKHTGKTPQAARGVSSGG